MPGNTETLLLGDNDSLKQISDHAFSGCATLRHLDLSRNGLSYIGKDAFSGIYQLRTLLLNSNNLNVYRLPPVTFSNLSLLEELAIQDNNVSLDVVDYNDQLFANLQNVKKLSLDGLPNATFGQGFSYLGSLRSLHIYGQTDLTWYISNNTFETLNQSDVRELVVRNSGMTDVEALAFAHFTHLETLDLSYSHLLGFPNQCKCWYGLQYTNISTLLLKTSKPTDYNLIKVEMSFYNYLDLTRLKKLVLDSNGILAIESGFSEYTKHLKHLSLAFNCLLVSLSLISDIVYLNYLLTVDVSFQYRNVLTAEGVDFQKTESLGGKLQWKPAHREHQTQMRRVGLRYLPLDEPVNRASVGDTAEVSDKQTSAHISRIFGNALLREKSHQKRIEKDRNGLVSQSINIFCPLRLKEFNMAAIMTADYDIHFSQFTFINCKNMRVLNASWNYLQKIEGPVTVALQQPKRLTVDLRENSLSWLDPELERRLDRLWTSYFLQTTTWAGSWQMRLQLQTQFVRWRTSLSWTCLATA